MRTFVITARLTPFALSFIRDRRRWLLFGAPQPRSADFHERRAARLVATLAALGPTFVKLAQIMASRADLVPEPYLAALGTLTDRVPPVPYDAVATTIESSYGQPIDALFERFDREPLAAASLGQVHRAQWHGRDVVVKVLRPGIAPLVAADVRAAERILGAVARRWDNRHVRALRTVVAEFGRRVWEEMDFRQEAAYAGEIRANFAGHPRVIVPRVVDEMTRERVLVLDYVDGRRIDDLAPWIAERRVEPRALVRTVMELYLQMMLVDGLFHADPHPGNLLVAPDGRVVILDFGMVVRVPREVRRELVHTVFAAIRRDVDRLLAGFQGLGLLEPGTDPASLRDLAARLLALASTRSTVAERLETLLADDVMAELYDAPVVLPSDMVYFARTAALIEGLGTRYDPYFNAIEFATPVALRLRGRIMASIEGRPLPRRDDWAAVFGEVLGEVAGVVHRAGREIAALFGARLWDPPRQPTRELAPPRALLPGADAA